MAARLNGAHQADIRAKIQTIQLVNRLQAYALGQKAPNAEEGDETPLELDQGRLKAIDMLLRKVLPDLSAVTISGDENNPLRQEMEVGPILAEFMAKVNAVAERNRDAGEPS